MIGENREAVQLCDVEGCREKVHVTIVVTPEPQFLNKCVCLKHWNGEGLAQLKPTYTRFPEGAEL